MSKAALSRAPAANDELAGLALGALPNLLGFHLRFANMAMYRDYANAMESLDLTQKQHAVLLIIKANHGVSQVDIAAALGTDRATMMAIVDRLEGRDLVERQRSKGDRRRQELYLTPAGLELAAAADALAAHHERKFTDRFTPEEREVLFGALRRIHRKDF